jgi:hypothetical protein
MTAQDTALARTKSIKFSDNQKVRDELAAASKPMAITNFFIRRPCVSIITPYVLLVLFAFVTFAAEFITLSFEQDDSGLVNDDPIVVQNDMIKYGKDNLFRDESGVDDKKEKMLENQVRYKSEGFNRILVIYESETDAITGLLSKE